ncbi:MAG: DnaJ domain-containing protein [Candidatus Eisenbacteria bacterium]
MGFKGTLLGGAFGWVLGGPIGAVVGGLFGDRAGGGKKGGGDTAVSLAVLLAAVTKAGGGVDEGPSGVRSFLAGSFGAENADDLMQIYGRALTMDLDQSAITTQLRGALDGPSRLELLHALFRLVAPEGPSSPRAAVVRQAGGGLGVPPEEVRRIEAFYRSDDDRAYSVLGAAPGDPPEEIRRKYRDLAKKYHPDRVAHLGDEFRALAEDRFKTIQDAYEKIGKEWRGDA